MTCSLTKERQQDKQGRWLIFARKKIYKKLKAKKDPQNKHFLKNKKNTTVTL